MWGRELPVDVRGPRKIITRRRQIEAHCFQHDDTQAYAATIATRMGRDLRSGARSRGASADAIERGPSPGYSGEGAAQINHRNHITQRIMDAVALCGANETSAAREASWNRETSKTTLNH